MIGKAEKMSRTDQVLKAWSDAFSMVAPESGRTPTESRSQYKRVRTPEGQETLLVSVWEKSDLDSVKQRSKFCQGLKELVVGNLPLAEKVVEFPHKYGVSKVLGSTETRPQGTRVPYHVGFLLDAEWPRPKAAPEEQVSDQKDVHMTPADEKYVDARLTSIEKTVEMGMSHQSQQMETLMAHLTEKVTEAVDQTRDARKELRQSQWWALSVFVALIILIAGSLITMLYNSSTVERTLGNDINEVRKEVRSTADKLDNLSKELGRINATLQKKP